MIVDMVINTSSGYSCFKIFILTFKILCKCKHPYLYCHCEQVIMTFSSVSFNKSHSQNSICQPHF